MQSKLLNILNTDFVLIAGPCTIKDEASLHESAVVLKQLGVSFLRGGAYKLRTSSRSFQGLGLPGIDMLANVGKALQMQTVSEIISLEDLDYMASRIDVLLVGTRSMSNYPLLKGIGRTNKPLILKRGMGSTILEWLQAAEYIREQGNDKIILCERGIRTFETSTRYTFDVSALPMVHLMSEYPVIADPSHSSGRRELILPLSMAAVGAGADGLMIETELEPELAVCDSQQTIDPTHLKTIIEKIRLFRGIL